MPFEHIRATLGLELNRDLADVFATFDQEPGASASIGQVHSASLREGGAVAVKVQRPGVAKLISDDMELLQNAARMLQERFALGRRLDVITVVEEFAGRC